jgi:hypothetical protein
VVTLHPQAVKAYLQNLDRLEALINSRLADDANGAVAVALRNLLESVTILPAPRGRGPELRLTGTLASLLPPAMWGTMVAGAGFEPATSGL